MTLVDDGMLDLDAPIVSYVPEVELADRDARAQITARQLLTHTAGFLGDRFDDQGNGDDALERAMRALGDLPQQTAPGELYTYCNAGIDLVGRAIENILGQTFESAMRERVFVPLGLERSTYFASEAIRHSVSVGHEEGGEDGLTVADPWPIPRRSNAAGGVISNVAELIRFAVMHLRDGAIGEQRIISAESAQAMRDDPDERNLCPRSGTCLVAASHWGASGRRAWRRNQWVPGVAGADPREAVCNCRVVEWRKRIAGAAGRGGPGDREPVRHERCPARANCPATGATGSIHGSIHASTGRFEDHVRRRLRFR